MGRCSAAAHFMYRNVNVYIYMSIIAEQGCFCTLHFTYILR